MPKPPRPGFIPAPKTMSLELIYSFNGVLMENVLHVRASADFTAAMLEEVVNVALGWDDDEWRHHRHISCHLVKLRGLALHAAVAPLFEVVPVAPNPGLVTGTALPANVTFAVGLTAFMSGRSNRGRLYMCGMATAQISGNQMLEGEALSIVGAIGDLQTRLDTHSPAYHLCVTSFFTDHHWRSEAVNIDVVDAVYYDLNLDSQRRRLTGRGH